MSSWNRHFCLFFLLASAVALAVADVDLPQGPGKDILENTCEECHGADRIVEKAWTKDKWRTTVNDMVSRGASLKPEEIDTLVDYLATYFGPDNKPDNSKQ
jgi:mono/diheme cytochrome c family protein